MTDKAFLKPRINKNDCALRQKVRALRAASGKLSKSQAGDPVRLPQMPPVESALLASYESPRSTRSPAALTPVALLVRADGTIYAPNYWSFIKGCSAAAAHGKDGMHDDDTRWRKKAERLLMRASERLTAYEKGYLFAVVTWQGPDAIALMHRLKVWRLCRKLNAAGEEL